MTDTNRIENCENTYNSIGIMVGMTGEEAKKMVDYWRSPRMPHDHWYSQCIELQESVKGQMKFIIELETELSQKRILFNKISEVADKVLRGLDWDTEMPVDLLQTHCNHLHKLIESTTKNPPQLMSHEDRKLNNPWKGNEQSQD